MPSYAGSLETNRASGSGVGSRRRYVQLRTSRAASSSFVQAYQLRSCSTEMICRTRFAKNSVEPPDPYSKTCIVGSMFVVNQRMALNVSHGVASASEELLAVSERRKGTMKRVPATSRRSRAIPVRRRSAVECEAADRFSSSCTPDTHLHVASTRVRIIDRWPEGEGVETLASYGVGGGVLEWWLLHIRPERHLVLADYAPETVERLRKLFPSAGVHRLSRRCGGTRTTVACCGCPTSKDGP